MAWLHHWWEHTAIVWKGPLFIGGCHFNQLNEFQLKFVTFGFDPHAFNKTVQPSSTLCLNECDQIVQE